MKRSLDKNRAGKVPLPEYRPPCFRGLRDFLGQADAAVEWIEVAARHLKTEHESGGNLRVDTLAIQYGIRVNQFDFDRLSPRWASLQVLSVYQLLEWFLDEFRAEHPRQVRARREKEDLLSYTLDAFAVSKHDVGMLEFEILDYYRLVRNHLMHNHTESQSKTHLTSRGRIEMLKEETAYAKLRAPNTLDAMGFDDFVLFSRAVKNLSRALCAVTCPTAEEFVSLLENDEHLRKVLGANRQNEERVRAKLASHLRRCYGLPRYANELSAAILVLSPLAQR